MKELELSTKMLLVAILMALASTIFNKLNTNANSSKSIEPVQQFVTTNGDDKIVRNKLNHKNKSNHKGNAIKSSTQALVGAWNSIIVSDSGIKFQGTVFYNSDGTYYTLVTKNDGTWYIDSQGTWQLSNGIVSQKHKTGKVSQGLIKFISDNELFYTGLNHPNSKQTKWQRINSKSDLSANQLVGTWSLLPMERVLGKLREPIVRPMVLTLLELNSDGTFRYENSDLTGGILGITVNSNRGTWEYSNNGYADGLLVLKNNKGQALSIGSVNWSSNREFFVHINRSELDQSKNQLVVGKIEKFRSTNVRID